MVVLRMGAKSSVGLMYKSFTFDLHFFTLFRLESGCHLICLGLSKVTEPNYVKIDFMKKVKLSTLLLLLMQGLFLVACGQESLEVKDQEANAPKEDTARSTDKALRGYVDWYCPDNIIGFPPVDVRELDAVPVVANRLPTREETQNGTSLMYIDAAEIPDAYPLDIPLPALARFYSESTRKNELVVVIQAVATDNDTVLGFRFASGGNGSARFHELGFLTEEEIGSLPPTSYVSDEIEIRATKKQVWALITGPENAEVLGSVFEDGGRLKSDWKRGTSVQLLNRDGQPVSNGVLTSTWPDTYLQVDYHLAGRTDVEKILILFDEFTNKTTLRIVCGPFGDDLDAKKILWTSWIQKVKELSES